MNLVIEWNEPVPLTTPRGGHLGYDIDLDQIPEAPGIYVFGRKFGKHLRALYVGNSINIRKRVKQHLVSVKLTEHVLNSKNGRKVLVAGVLKGGAGPNLRHRLLIAERAAIRHFVLEDSHDLMNIHGTTMREHTIESRNVTARFVPRVLYLEHGAVRPRR